MYRSAQSRSYDRDKSKNATQLGTPNPLLVFLALTDAEKVYSCTVTQTQSAVPENPLAN